MKGISASNAIIRFVADFLRTTDGVLILSSEREKVLRVLNDYNLNAFSLFGSQESLLETMWLREYTLKKDMWQP
jgi:hypothetical protein